MKSFTITVEEILARDVTIEANTLEEAIEVVSKQWSGEEIVLDSDDFQTINIYLQGEPE